MGDLFTHNFLLHLSFCPAVKNVASGIRSHGRNNQEGGYVVVFRQNGAGIGDPIIYGFINDPVFGIC